MNHDNNMEGDVTKLLALLKKILKNYPQGSDQIAKFMDQKSFNLNLCFLTFVPMSPEDLMEFEEMYEEYFNRSDEPLPSKAGGGKLEFKLNSEDVHFLKQNGICF